MGQKTKQLLANTPRANRTHISNVKFQKDEGDGKLSEK
jgi:hypothetical protein